MGKISIKPILFGSIGIIANYAINTLLDTLGFNMWLASIIHSTNAHIFFWGITSAISLVILIIMYPYVFIKKQINTQLISIDKENNYLCAIGALLDLLNGYDYSEPYLMRSNILCPHNQYTSAYDKLEDFRKSVFYDEKLSLNLKQFLSYFEFWSNGLAIPNFNVYQIKPIFKNRKDYLQNEPKIKNIAKDIKEALF